MYGTEAGMNRAFGAPNVGFCIIPGALPQAEGESRAVGAEEIRQHPLHPQPRHSKRLAVAKAPSRPVANKDDLDLSPPEEIRARRIRRFVFLGAVAAAVLGVAIYFAAPPIGGAIKGWQSRRLAREAFALIDQKKWNEATAKARDAYCCVHRTRIMARYCAGGRLAQINGRRRWNGGKRWMTHIASRSRIGATMSAPRSRPVK